MSARLSPEDLDYLRRSCEQSGVPLRVADRATVVAAADILRPRRPAPVSRREPGRRAA